MITLLFMITVILCLIAFVFPEKKDTMYGCIISMWKFIAILFAILFAILLISYVSYSVWVINS